MASKKLSIANIFRTRILSNKVAFNLELIVALKSIISIPPLNQYYTVKRAQIMESFF